ncbi:hypothetical protein ACFOZY_00235 [Chungangia koreensis]|uniref:EamA-like transporter family protein n=1 Tax=Chungangia koreensis TaxID=752657 RepID=A0ABV8WZD2_9LACT
MNTNWLMSSSAVVMGLWGFVGTFLPKEIANFLGIDASPITLILLQIIGGLYFGFAMLNWFTRSARIGGIYNRPVVLGNMSHFIVVAFALIRQLIDQVNFILILMTVIYVVFAICFGYVFRANPLKDELKNAA